MFLRVVVFYLITMVVSGALNALQAATGPDPDLIQLVQFAPAIAVGAMFLLFRRTTKVQARFTPAAEVAGRSAVTHFAYRRPAARTDTRAAALV
jgi:hypothetical protein